MSFRRISFLEVDELFYLDDTSPSGLRWKVNRYCGRNGNILQKVAGEVAGSKTDKGYYRVRAHGTYLYTHRIVYCLKSGQDLGKEAVVDHEDGDPSNNAPSNLRNTNHKINSRNRFMPANNTSGTTGVSWQNNGYGHRYAVASWCDRDGKPHKKHFSETKLGTEEAYRQACDFRKTMIGDLEGYTARHGLSHAWNFNKEER